MLKTLLLMAVTRALMVQVLEDAMLQTACIPIYTLHSRPRTPYLLQLQDLADLDRPGVTVQMGASMTANVGQHQQQRQ